MAAAILFFCTLLSGIFLSSALSKRSKMEEHVAIVADYRILPEAMVRPLAIGEVYVEGALAVLLLIGSLRDSLLPWAALGSLLLLAVYSAAIGINLLRGRREISCGCGGVAGNHLLSWKLVLRNLVLMAGCGWVWKNAGALETLDSIGTITTMTAAGLTLMAWVLYTELNKVRTRIKTIWTSKEEGA
ncbi:hypothetical protein CBW65_03700 [Tumebacillus avium]|uniref:Methylamine utilisation protein MauE domain-containing protein n=1 Tax=Tumebacillus avium TaxID=1903704 RepID=A0A1Y0IKA4_9BACL|nr:MauE/DoxX family redox-associated membrane protein [Tumebacillus avium]ARU60266.1 hypothetical protein CBW65_03700 [Tumebacillus avium]